MQALRWVGFSGGIFVILFTGNSIMRTIVMPRGTRSNLSVFVGRRLVLRSFIFLANRFEDYETKDKILAGSAPMGLIALLAVWLGLIVLGFGLVLWPMVGDGLGSALLQSGSSVFTLGIEHATGAAPDVVYFFASAFGLVVVALQIAYLPTMYSAFNRRETFVTLLQSRAGSPAWGPEILVRAQLVGLRESLPDLYAQWEQWAAEVAESHTNYPVLLFFRSPHPLRSWVLALLAVLDAAALQNALFPESAPIEARLVLRMGFTCLRAIADAMGIEYDPDPFPHDPLQLEYDEFLGGVRVIQDAGYELERSPEEAWPHFKGWRVNYESIAYAVADYVTAPPGPWSGPRKHLPGLNLIPQRPRDRKPGAEQREVPKSDIPTSQT
ncbi:MAG: hypothetical protein ABR579_11530 [Actinomycetota bacterium]